MAFLSTITRDYRHGLMMDLMDREGLDALIFRSGDFFQFATNFATDVQTWERPIACVVPRNGAPFAILNELSTHHWRYALEDGRLWVTDASFFSEHPRATNRLPLLPQWPSILAGLLQAHGLHRARIGVETNDGLMAQAAALLPDLKVVPMLAAMREMRWVKNDEELALMRQLCDLSDWLQDRYRENIRPGRAVLELDLSMQILLGQEAARRFPREQLDILYCFSFSGPCSAAPHGDGRQIGATIEKGHGMINLIVPRLNGLVIENERTWFCGKPTPEQARYFDLGRQATEAACAAARVGNRVCDIDAAALTVFEKAGVGEHVYSRTGHGMGVLCHEWPEDMAFNTRPLRAGEVYSAEPGLYIFGLGGFRHDDTVVVGTEPEVLTKAPMDLASQTIL
jgi:Xaa-Pro aminopeptidase